MKLNSALSVMCVWLCILSGTAYPDTAHKSERLSERWADYVSAEDRQRLDDFDSTIKKIEQSFKYDEFDAESRDEYDRYQAIKAQPNLSITEQDLTGSWKCRAIQPGPTGVVRYPYFNCEITRVPRGLFLEKITGSQRFSGYVFKGGQNDYIFLGGLTVNDDPQIDFSGISMLTDKTQDMMGQLVRKKNRLVLVGVTRDGFYNFYELTR